jgi:cysteine desulfurase/selenocysteine lyase
MTARTRLVAVGHVSNVTGMVMPVREIVAEARQRGVLTLVDGAQSVSHLPVDVRELGCDFFAFSGHKMLGPSGIGALYARKDLLTAASPMLLGGGMVASVTANGFHAETGPARFEAGTPNIEGSLGMGAAARYLMDLGMETVQSHARELAAALVEGLSGIEGVQLFPGPCRYERMPIVSFSLPRMSAGDAAAILCNRYNVMVRSGLHCAEPLARHFGQTGFVRVSLQVYNTAEEVAAIVDAVRNVRAALR